MCRWRTDVFAHCSLNCFLLPWMSTYVPAKTQRESRSLSTKQSKQNSLLSPSPCFIVTTGTEWLLHDTARFSRVRCSAEARIYSLRARKVLFSQVSGSLFSRQNMPHHFCLVPWWLFFFLFFFPHDFLKVN